MPIASRDLERMQEILGNPVDRRVRPKTPMTHESNLAGPDDLLAVAEVVGITGPQIRAEKNAGLIALAPVIDVFTHRPV